MPITTSDPIVGRTVVGIRVLTDREIDEYAWFKPHGEEIPVLVLDDGTELFCSQDPEGNGPGTFFGKSPAGDFTLQILSETR